MFFAMWSVFMACKNYEVGRNVWIMLKDLANTKIVSRNVGGNGEKWEDVLEDFGRIFYKRLWK